VRSAADTLREFRSRGVLGWPALGAIAGSN